MSDLEDTREGLVPNDVVKKLWIDQVVKGLKGDNPERFLAIVLANIVEGILDIKDVLVEAGVVTDDAEPPKGEVGN